MVAAALLLAVPGCGASTLEARTARAEKRCGKSEDYLMRAERQLDALEAVEAAESIAEAREQLSDPDITLYPDYDILRQRLAAAESRLPAVQAARRKRDLDRAVAERRERVQKAADRLEAAMGPLKEQGPSRDRVKAARKGIEELTEELGEGKALEGQDAGYAAFAEKLRKGLAEANAIAALGGQLVEFMDGPWARMREGREKLARAQSATDAGERVELLEEALSRFSGCAEEGKRQIGKSPNIGICPVSVDGVTNTPSAVVATCVADRGVAEARLEVEKKRSIAEKAKLAAEKAKKEAIETEIESRKAQDEARKAKAEAQKVQAEASRAPKKLKPAKLDDARRAKDRAQSLQKDADEAVAAARKALAEAKKAQAEADKAAREAQAARGKARAK